MDVRVACPHCKLTSAAGKRMTRTDDQMVHETIDDTIDESMRDAADGQRARKRAEIGLAPNRPTARADLQRPPTKEESPDASMRWWKNPR